MKVQLLVEAIQKGELTIRELRGITEQEMLSALHMGKKIMQAGDPIGAAQVFAGLALYDPFFAEVWQALEELFRGWGCNEQANWFARLAQIMSG